MNTAQLIIVCVTALAALVIVTQARVKREHATPAAPIPGETAERVGPSVGARVAVHKLDGQTLQGEIVAQDADEMVLEKVDVITAGTSQATGGRFHISRDRIDSIQEL